MSTNTIAFDIENGPETNEHIRLVSKPFDPDKVATDNLKDPAKIEAKIQKESARHERDMFDRAALDGMTGQVLAIGALAHHDDTHHHIWCVQDAPHPSTEADVLNEFWRFWQRNESAGVHWVGFNCFNFDLPFLIFRSCLHDVPVPLGLWAGAYWPRNIIDLYDWARMRRYGWSVSLDRLCQCFGIGKKTGSGKDWHLLFAKDKVAALDYLKNDCDMTLGLARKLQAIQHQSWERR